MPRAIISPSVLASDFGQLSAECKRMIKGGAEWLHMDSILLSDVNLSQSSHFVPNISMGAPVLSCVHKGVPGIFMDCHMMVAQPEKPPDAVSLINAIHARNMKAGVAISPDTPSTAITDEIGAVADMLLVMTVASRGAGRGGQKFLERCVPKVAELRARFPEKDIEVDGGVGPKTIDICADAGSNVIVAGTAIFNAPNPEGVITSLKTTVNTAQARFSK
ncbi:ribulose-5-phosphate 3-epimerase [Suillus discolor]|uniref:Ribulose-phosphate 3-epimerase n=1 Tax=Suillus discolor TaxID=1912936 RepID=A0A9P7FJR5_9AGAM|nr:ribulose-5-phosphate 3-epimerase [Suillus discolor]KAG2120780.1 ribulose-5-phosphate 3-epimerase [Suillus discolor]